MTDSIKYFLPESEMPKSWYNIVPICLNLLLLFSIPELDSRSGPMIWPRCFRWI